MLAQKGEKKWLMRHAAVLKCVLHWAIQLRVTHCVSPFTPEQRAYALQVGVVLSVVRLHSWVNVQPAGEVWLHKSAFTKDRQGLLLCKGLIPTTWNTAKEKKRNQKQDCVLPAKLSVLVVKNFVLKNVRNSRNPL
ncbi:hypothetical protein CDAR_319601 [Caerostris darwini]|uniref:Uncharacterized protein n=1 Tax=Caerostris darwini TaxID=1538125 RepID=A0AAV4V8P7_9ARAC|nr:hypothetical protein CDAR_319601 [Caerostris darwini]